jgi:Tfp pilus assembly protein PilO
MTLRPRDRIALVAVLMVALAGAYYLLALKPEQNKASTLASSITAQRQALTTAEANYAVGKAAQTSIKTSAPEWAALRKAVPDTSDIPALLRVLERNANAVHVKMKAITITAPASPAAGTTASPSTATPSTAASASPATSIPIQLSFAGGYVELHNLVQRLDGLVVVSGHTVHATGPLLSISNVSLTGSPKLTVQLTATIYQLAAAPGTGAATTGGQS